MRTEAAKLRGGFVDLGQSPGSSWLVEGRSGGAIWGTAVSVQEVTPCTGDGIIASWQS